MSRIENIQNNRAKLFKEYRLLVEEAYNLRQTDSALSDLTEYKALKLLNELNLLKYLERGKNKLVQ